MRLRFRCWGKRRYTNKPLSFTCPSQLATISHFHTLLRDESSFSILNRRALSAKTSADQSALAGASSGITAAKYPNAFVHLTAGGTGAVQCIAYSDGTNWKQIAVGVTCV